MFATSSPRSWRTTFARRSPRILLQVEDLRRRAGEQGSVPVSAAALDRMRRSPRVAPGGAASADGARLMSDATMRGAMFDYPEPTLYAAPVFIATVVLEAVVARSWKKRGRDVVGYETSDTWASLAHGDRARS